MNIVLCAQMLASAFSTPVPGLPPVDCDGRYPTHNRIGYCDPHFNETQKAFVERAITRTRRNPYEPVEKVPIVLEIGGGFTPLGPMIVGQGGSYLYIDKDPIHARVADQLITDSQNYDLQAQVAVGEVPITGKKEGEQLHRKLEAIRNDYTVTDIGVFSVLMYIDGENTVRFLKWAYKLLPPGGRLYITGASAYGNAFPTYESDYESRLAMFLRTGGREISFPGWMPDLTHRLFNPHVPNGFLEKYPPYFHILDHRVLGFYAKQIGFNVVEGKFLHRALPEKFLYKGPRTDVGELTSIVLEKPEKSL